MCIKDKIWLKNFVLALLGFGLYLVDTGSDTWVGHQLIQKCHVRFGVAVLCLVYVLPGKFSGFTVAKEFDNGTIFQRIFIGVLTFIFCVPITAGVLPYNLIKLDDAALGNAKL